MNEQEKEIAEDILRKAKNTAKYVSLYLALMRAVKLRLECEKMVAAQPVK